MGRYTYNTMQKLIVTRMKGGANAVESAALLTDLIESHTGDNLASALLYNGFVRGASAAQLAADKLAA